MASPVSWSRDILRPRPRSWLLAANLPLPHLAPASPGWSAGPGNCHHTCTLGKSVPEVKGHVWGRLLVRAMCRREGLSGPREARGALGSPSVFQLHGPPGHPVGGGHRHFCFDVPLACAPSPPWHRRPSFPIRRLERVPSCLPETRTGPSFARVVACGGQSPQREEGVGGRLCRSAARGPVQPPQGR